MIILLLLLFAFFVSLAAVIVCAVQIKRFGKIPLFVSLAALGAVVIGAVLYLSSPATSEDYSNMAQSHAYEDYIDGTLQEGEVVEVSGKVLSLTGNTIPLEELFVLDTPDGAFYIQNSTGEILIDGEEITVTGNFSGLAEGDPLINAHYIK